MKPTFTLLFTFCFLMGFAQGEDTYRVIIFPSDIRNHSIYDLSDKKSFGSLFIKHYEDNCISDYFFSEADHAFKDREDFKQITLRCENYTSPRAIFFSPKMDLYVFQQRDSITGMFKDIGYEFYVKLPSSTDYVHAIGIDLRSSRSPNAIHSTSLLNNENLYSLQQEYKFNEMEWQTFSWFFSMKNDFQMIKEKPVKHFRIKEYSLQRNEDLIKCENHLLADLHSNPEHLKMKTSWKMKAVDSSDLKFAFQYDKGEPRKFVESLVYKGEDSVVMLPDGSQVIILIDRDRFDLEIKHLSHVHVLEEGTYDTNTRDWQYEPVAFSLKFSPEILGQPLFYDPVWFYFSSLGNLRYPMEYDTYEWIRSVEKLQDGEVISRFEPEERFGR